MIVESSVFDEFVDRFVSKASEWQVGDPTNEGTRLGPMASLSARNDLADQVEDAVAKGAVVHLGGEVLEGPGSFYPATVLTGVTPQMRAFARNFSDPLPFSTKSIRSTTQSPWRTIRRSDWVRGFHRRPRSGGRRRQPARRGHGGA